MKWFGSVWARVCMWFLVWACVWMWFSLVVCGDVVRFGCKYVCMQSVCVCTYICMYEFHIPMRTTSDDEIGQFCLKR